MTPSEIAALGTPISPDEPCGSDLELSGDPDYMRFVARIETVLPASFASFRRGSIDFPSEFATLKALLARTRDLRLLVPLAKLSVLNRDVPAYCAVLKLIEQLAEEAWDTVLPGLIEDDAMLRVVTLQTLDDMADSVMPLQAAPLFETRRFGKFSFRSRLLADGLAKPREPQGDDDQGEPVPDASAVSAALGEVDVGALTSARALMLELRASLTRLEELVDQRTGKSGLLRFARLGALVQDIATFLDKSVVARDPALALEPVAVGEPGAASEEPGAPVEPAAAIGSTAAAQAALAAAAAYFAQSEPSSPVLLVIGQAQALVGRSFFESLQVLLPDLSAKAMLPLGKEAELALPLERLAALPPTVAENSGESSRAADSEAGDAAPTAPSDTAPLFTAPDRRTAIGLLQQVAAHFRRTEPSSPIPLLLERADRMAGKDFVTLLRDALPAGSLSIDG